MKYFYTLLLFSFVFISCKVKSNNKTEISSQKITSETPKLIKLWETDSLLTMCESVIFNKSKSVIYVSNINTGPWEEDKDGFISTIDTLGNILNLKWIDGLDGPKGLGIHKNKLYTSDIDEILEIDIDTKEITNRYKVEGTPYLNDITISPNGTVYVSGIKSNAIYALKNKKTTLVTKQDFKSLNGILHDREGIYYITSEGNKFGIYNEEDKTTKTLTEDIRTGDGIVKLPNGDFITSNWKGSIFYIKSSDWSKKLLLDTTESKINAADINYIPEQNMLLVPTFFNNTVRAYRLVFE